MWSLKVPEEVIEEITSGNKPQAIVHAPPAKGKGKTFWQFEAQFMKALLGSKSNSMFNIYNKKTKTFNILKADPDFQNCNGWSLMVTKKKLPALRGSNIGLLMVKLTKVKLLEIYSFQFFYDQSTECCGVVCVVSTLYYCFTNAFLNRGQ